MRLAYGLKRLLGSVYSNGNVVFVPPHGTQVICPVLNRLNVIDLANHEMYLLPCEGRSNLIMIAVSNDGKLLLTLDEEGRALLINLPRRVIMHRHFFGGGKKAVRAMAFSPDNRHIAIAVGKEVQVWRTPGLKLHYAPMVLERTYGGQHDDINSIAWHSDSKHLLAGSSDMTARVYHHLGEAQAQALAQAEGSQQAAMQVVKAGFTPTTLSGHRDVVIGVFFDGSDENVAYSVAKDGGVFTWEYEWQEGVRSESIPKRSPSSHLRSAGASGRWRLKSKMFLRPGRGGVEGEGRGGSISQVNGLACHLMRAEAAARLLRVTHLKAVSWAAPNHLPPLHHSQVAFHSKLGLIVIGFSNGVFGLYEMPGCVNVHTLSIGHHSITAAAINNTGEWLCFGCASEGQLLVWEWQSETYVVKQSGHNYGLSCLAISPNGSLCATGGADNKVKLWSMSTGFSFVTFDAHAAPVTGVAFTSNGSAVVSCSLDGTVKAHDMIRYKQFRSMTTPAPVQLSAVALDPAGEVVVAGSMDPFELYVWSLQTGRLLDVFAGHEAPISEISFSPNLPVVASSSWDGTVKLWNVYKNELVETLEMPADVLAVAFRPDGKQVCCACLNGTLQMWGVEDGDSQGIIDGKRDIAGGRRAHDMTTASVTNRQYFTTVSYSADGSCVIAGGESNYICIYECSQRLLVKKFKASINRSLDGVTDMLHSGQMTEAGSLDLLQMDGNDDFALEEEQDKARRGEGGSQATRPATRVSCIRFSPSGREWAAACTDGVLVYSLDEAASFEPFQLDETVTPKAVEACICRREWVKALVMSFHLNEAQLCARAIDAVPMSEVPLVAKALPEQHACRLVELLSIRLKQSAQLEYHLVWCRSVLTSHGKVLRSAEASLAAMRSLQREIDAHGKELFRMIDDNYYTLQFIAQQHD
ncbi:unnamed protein product [Chrysoparadoxa australica]